MIDSAGRNTLLVTGLSGLLMIALSLALGTVQEGGLNLAPERQTLAIAPVEANPSVATLPLVEASWNTYTND